MYLPGVPPRSSQSDIPVKIEIFVFFMSIPLDKGNFDSNNLVNISVGLLTSKQNKIRIERYDVENEINSKKTLLYAYTDSFY